MPLALLALVLSAALAWPATASAAWIWPVEGRVVSDFSHDGSRYGAGFHRGIDIEAGPGTPVAAATDGLVTFVGRAADSGLTVGIRTADGRFDTAYLHLEAAGVEKGQTVGAGAVIGLAGVSGRPSSTVPHLHFGVRDAGTESAYRDPLDFLEGRAEPPAPPAAGPLPPRGPSRRSHENPRTAPSPRARPHPVRRPEPRPVPDRVPVESPQVEGSRPMRRAADPATGQARVPQHLPGTGAHALDLPARALAGPGAGAASRMDAHAPRRTDVGRSPARAGAGGTGPGLARWIGAVAAFVLVLTVLAGARGGRLSSIAQRWATTSQRRSTT